MARPTHIPEEDAIILDDEVLDTSRHDAAIQRLEKMADLLDDRFSIGGIRFGLDGLIGLIPGIGDAATGAVSLFLALEGARFGVRKRILALMIYNVIIDSLLGIIPFVGDIFDFANKANLKNVHILRRELERKRDAAKS